MDYEGNILKQKIIRFRNKMEKCGAILIVYTYCVER